MTSDSKVKANRANARVSTGPKTAQGRARAARNAHRHGLSLPLYANPTLSKEVEALADKIAGANANAEIRQLACRIAEAQIDLRRVRHAQHQFLSDNLKDIQNGFGPNMPENEEKTVIDKLVRSNMSRIPMDLLFEYVMTPMPPEPQKSTTIVSQTAKQLVAMDRYERRALSRRKFAVREFDLARRKSEIMKNRDG